MELPKANLKEIGKGRFLYQEEDNACIMAPTETIQEEEARLICYSIVTCRKICVSPPKKEQLEQIYRSGELPTLFGFLTKKQRGFCIQKEEGSYKLYMGVNRRPGVYKVLHRILMRAKEQQELGTIH